MQSDCTTCYGTIIAGWLGLCLTSCVQWTSALNSELPKGYIPPTATSRLDLQPEWTGIDWSMHHRIILAVKSEGARNVNSNWLINDFNLMIYYSRLGHAHTETFVQMFSDHSSFTCLLGLCHCFRVVCVLTWWRESAGWRRLLGRWWRCDCHKETVDVQSWALWRWCCPHRWSGCSSASYRNTQNEDNSHNTNG